jgi:CHAT domain-containing protein
MRAALTAAHPPSRILDSQYPVHSALRLHDLLLGGLEECLQGSDHISYIALRDIADLPLHALLAKAPPTTENGYDLARAEWLALRFDFSYISSLQEFVAAKALSKTAGGQLPFLGVGDPILGEPVTDGLTGGEQLALRGSPTVSGKLRSLPELPETGEELRAIARSIPNARILTRSLASEERVRMEPLGHYNIISFATHGIIGGEIPEIPDAGLVLTPVEGRLDDPSDDGFLSAGELATMKLNAKLVILSACNTANFDTGLFRAGMRGLTAALAVSGVPTVLASLWPVESETSRRLMTGFFDALKEQKHISVAAAFGQSIRKFLSNPPSSEFLHPRFWAPFLVFGDGTIQVDAAPTNPLKITEWLATVDPGGEVIALTGSEDDALFISRFGETDGKRFASFVERRGNSGDVDWQVKDRSIGAAHIKATARRVFSTGYISEDKGRNFIPVIRTFDLEGNPGWSRTFEYDANSLILDLLPMGDGKVAVLVQNIVKMGRSRESRFFVLHLDSLGDTYSIIPIKVREDLTNFTIGKLVFKSNGLYVLIDYPMQTGQMANAPSNDFGDPGYCFHGAGLAIFAISWKTKEATFTGFYPRLRIRSAKSVNDKIYVAGMIEEKCDQYGYAYLGELSNDGSLKTIYFNKELYRSELADVDEKEGQFYAVGTWGKQFSVRSRDLDWKEYPVYRGINDDYIMYESFVVVIGNEGAETTEHFINAGISVNAMGLRVVGDKLVVVGSVGLNPLWAGLRISQ